MRGGCVLGRGQELTPSSAVRRIRRQARWGDSQDDGVELANLGGWYVRSRACSIVDEVLTSHLGRVSWRRIGCSNDCEGGPYDREGTSLRNGRRRV